MSSIYLCKGLDFIEIVLEQLRDRLSDVTVLGCVEMLISKLWVRQGTKCALTGHIPDFSLVIDTTTEQPPTRRPVAVVVTRVKVWLILQLFLDRQFVEGISESELSVDLLLGDTKVGHIKETLRSNSLDQNLCQLCGSFRGSIFGKINVGD